MRAASPSATRRSHLYELPTRFVRDDSKCQHEYCPLKTPRGLDLIRDFVLIKYLAFPGIGGETGRSPCHSPKLLSLFRLELERAVVSLPTITPEPKPQI